MSHPKYYNSHRSGIEAWDLCEQLSFNLGNAVKYLFRAGLKDGALLDHDMRKARSYLERLSRGEYPVVFVGEFSACQRVLATANKVQEADPNSVLGLVLKTFLTSNAQIRISSDLWTLEISTFRSDRLCLTFDSATSGIYIPYGPVEGLKE